MFKIRFNLSRGINFRKWKITTPNKNYFYFDPNEVTIKINNGRVINKCNTANEIFNGANKKVCSWIECENVDVQFSNDNLSNLSSELTYNPRITPNWVQNGENIDFKKFPSLITNNNKVYINEDSDYGT